MRIGVLGTGVVGVAIASRLVELGHSVQMGARKAGNNSANTWVASAGSLASHGTFADAAAHGDLVFNCTAGAHALEVVKAVGEPDGKSRRGALGERERIGHVDQCLARHVLLSGSLGEQIQRAFPTVNVVKSLNTVTAPVMVRPTVLGHDHSIFMAGDNTFAKAETAVLLGEFGWGAGQIIDLGDITAARAAEAYLLLWLRLVGTLDGPQFNIGVVR